jgi:glutamine synthetase
MYLSDGRRIPFDTRTVLRRTLGELADEGYDYVAGLELEWCTTKLEDPGADGAHACGMPD